MTRFSSREALPVGASSAEAPLTTANSRVAKREKEAMMDAARGIFTRCRMLLPPLSRACKGEGAELDMKSGVKGDKG
jgi:hypothetical protein